MEDLHLLKKVPKNKRKIMGNPISPNIKIGTLGELLVQIRFLQYDIQAAPPLKDSGNDLIAILGETFKGIQVKTTTKQYINKTNLPEHYHILAIVKLCGESTEIFLDQSQVYLIPRENVDDTTFDNISQFAISQKHIDYLFK
jgi:hypothetical protein